MKDGEEASVCSAGLENLFSRDAGLFRVHKSVFTDQEIFDLEIERIFEGTWVFVGMASEVPNPHDYLTVTIGRHPLIVMRDSHGKLGCFVNSCRHRGARLCQFTKGHSPVHVCPYHGWSFTSAGQLQHIKERAAGGYPPAFDQQDLSLIRVAHFGAYRGFLFASLEADVPPLEEHLGDARRLIDLICDQSPAGEVELVPGACRYRFNGNWKFQLENCTDAYHFTSTHLSLMRLMERQARSDASAAAVPVYGCERPIWETENLTGNFALARGMVTAWSTVDPRPSMPLFRSAAEVAGRVGSKALAWMFSTRNTTFFPNMQLACNFATQLRVIRPIAPATTEMTTYCIAPLGEPAESRCLRLRQYEDFFNSTGLAGADDNAVYEDCQVGDGSILGAWLHGYSRGSTVRRSGGEHLTRELGIDPVSSVRSTFALGDETVFQALYEEWLRLMKRVPAPKCAVEVHG
jgi:benzoate/toluate 1,2-dioxygenase subunit alpha